MSPNLNAVERRFMLSSYNTINRFRSARGKVLRRLIDALAEYLGRDVHVLDVGGRPDYWSNVGFGRISKIELLNLEPAELERSLPDHAPSAIFIPKVGDARSLIGYADSSIDLVHSNSVIEHVGGWSDMEAMARELLRVGRAGWVQTPAWAFPLEPHFRVPFAHWFARPVQVRMMSLSFVKRYREANFVERQKNVGRINLLTRRDLETIFPGRSVYVERLIFPKSYSVYWLPTGANAVI